MQLKPEKKLIVQTECELYLCISSSCFTPAGEDYTNLVQQLAFMPGDVRRCVDIVILNDNIDEDVQSFFVNLMGTSVTIFRSTATVSITDNGM